MNSILSSDAIVRALAQLGPTSVVVLAAVRAHGGTDGRCRVSVPRLAESCALHRLTVTRHLTMLVSNGFITEHEDGSGRVGRDVVDSTGTMVEFSRNELKLADPFALLLLLRTMGEAFVAKIDSIAAAARISRDTVDRYLAILQGAKLVTRQRVSRSEYRYRIVMHVPEKVHNVPTSDEASPCACGCGDMARAGNRFIQGHSFGAHASLRHGLSDTPEYTAYMHAKNRCENPKDASYEDYGGKGIKFLFSSLEQWIATLGKKPGPEYSVDRWPDPYGPYSPTNVRWATALQQQHNRRDRERPSPRKMFMRGASLVEVAQTMLRNVNAGTSAKSDRVCSADSALVAKATEVMRRMNIPQSSGGKAGL